MDMSGFQIRTTRRLSNREFSAKLRSPHRRGFADHRARLMESPAEIPNIEVIGAGETESAALAADASKRVTGDAAVLDLQLRQGTGLGS